MSLVKWFGPTSALVMAPNSPQLIYTDRVRATDIYMGKQSVCVANMLARGTYGSGIRLGWVINQCKCDTTRGDVGTLTYEWEAGGASATQPLPVGNVSLKPQELYPKLERNPYFSGIQPQTLNYAYNYLYTATNTTGTPAITQKLADWLAANITTAHGYASGDITTQINFATNLINKLMQGEETYYLAGWRYTYEIFSYAAPAIVRGGAPGVPAGPLSAVLPSGVDWLRLADDVDPAGVNGSMYKLTVTWLGGPTGHWDTDIYT